MVDIRPVPKYRADIVTMDDGTEGIRLQFVPEVRVYTSDGRQLYDHAQATSGVREARTLGTMTTRQATGLLASLVEQLGWLAEQGAALLPCGCPVTVVTDTGAHQEGCSTLTGRPPVAPAG